MLEQEIREILLKNSIDNIMCSPNPISPLSLARVICAFANTDGGYIIWGALRSNEIIEVKGLSKDFYLTSIIEQTYKLLSGDLRTTYECICIDGKRLFVIRVFKSSDIILCKDTKYVVVDSKYLEIKDVVTMDKTKVFIVHGHDDLALIQTQLFVEKLGLKAIVLNQQVNGGRTIIEKIEDYSNVGFAIVLYTPCDQGKEKNETDLKYRARQNVVFEHGYLMAKIGRTNVCALLKSEVEAPNDLSGVVYTPMDDAGAWQNKVIQEMKNAGYNVDANNLIN